MSATHTYQRMADGKAPPDVVVLRRAKLTAGLLILAAVVVVLALASLAVGSHTTSISAVWTALTNYPADPSIDEITVRSLRLPRTALAICVGMALGMAGSLMQALTRNPLADPGILGVNSGAALAVVIGISVYGLHTLQGYLWLALLGAFVTSVGVYALGAVGRSGASPVRLALAGTAVGAVLNGFISAIVLLDRKAFDGFREWVVGSLAGKSMDTLLVVVPLVAVGIVLSLSMGGALNALAMGDDTARALGAKIARTRAVGVVAVTLLCGVATAAVGPIGFIGLVVPHIARAITGPDHKWLLPYAVLLGAILVLASDVAGRLIVRPSELEVGVVTALIGAPVFIYLVRRRRLAQL
ncbi:iron chelate uptake ABC transporter family permease subunit [Micromonospora sp. B11E3]|uniref:FecCD family ABC transporter permease n=1 Tax=Micromonospora sp. B11E3 TaxID=3153562 RepID=UPI00325D628A